VGRTVRCRCTAVFTVKPAAIPNRIKSMPVLEVAESEPDSLEDLEELQELESVLEPVPPPAVAASVSAAPAPLASQRLAPAAAAAGDLFALDLPSGGPKVAPLEVADLPAAPVMPLDLRPARDDDVDYGDDDGFEKIGTFGNLYLPLAMFAVGLITNIVMSQAMASTFVGGLLVAFTMLVVQAVIFLPVAVAALFITARALDASFGTLPVAMIKLGAVTLGTGAIGDSIFLRTADLIGYDQYLLMFGFFIYLVSIGLPLALMFRAALEETCMIVAIIIIPRFIVLFTIGLTAPELIRA
jgi:hypothetical protein